MGNRRSFDHKAEEDEDEFSNDENKRVRFEEFKDIEDLSSDDVKL